MSKTKSNAFCPIIMAMNQRGAIGIALTALACSLISVVLTGFTMYNQSRYSLQIASDIKAEAKAQADQAKQRLQADKDLTTAINGTNEVIAKILGVKP